MFDESHNMFRESLRNFIDREILPYVDEWEDGKSYPAKKLFKKLGREGYLGLIYPSKYGGLELDYLYTVIWGEELGRISCGGLPMCLSVQTDMCLPAINKYGSEYLKEEFLKPAILGDKIGAIAITEKNSGSNLLNISTYAEEDGDDFRLNGVKSYITNGSIAGFYVVFCLTETAEKKKAYSLLLVPSGLEGIKVSKEYNKLGNFCANHAEITFDNVKVPQKNIIGKKGQGYKIQMDQFQHERLIISIISCTQCERIFKRIRKYIKQRNVFKKELIYHDNIAFNTVDLFTEIQFLKQMVYNVALSFMKEKECTCEIAMIKYKSADLLKKLADFSLQIHAGVGYMEDINVMRDFRDVRSASIAGGTNEIMKHIIKKFI